MAKTKKETLTVKQLRSGFFFVEPKGYVALSNKADIGNSSVRGEGEIHDNVRRGKRVAYDLAGFVSSSVVFCVGNDVLFHNSSLKILHNHNCLALNNKASAIIAAYNYRLHRIVFRYEVDCIFVLFKSL